MPLPALPEMRLRRSAVTPPITLALASVIWRPSLLLGSAAVPAGLVPISLPMTRLLLARADGAGVKIRTPAWALPEMTFPRPVPGVAVGPPIVLFDEP